MKSKYKDINKQNYDTSKKTRKYIYHLINNVFSINIYIKINKKHLVAQMKSYIYRERKRGSYQKYPKV